MCDKRKRLVTTLICLFLFIAFGPAFAAPPVSPSSPLKLKLYTGFPSPDADIIRAILKDAYQRIGIEAEVIQLPARRALLLANSAGDGAAGRVGDIKEITPTETSNLLLVPEVIHTMRMAVFTTGLEFPVQGWDSLTPYRNGARIGCKFSEKFLPQGREKFLLPTRTQLFKMLMSDRIDTVVDWENFGLSAIKEMGLTGIKLLPDSIAEKNFFHLLHTKHAHLVPQITKALQEQKESGDFTRIQAEVLAELLD